MSTYLHSDMPILTFASAEEWEKWLAQNFHTDGVWVRFYKKNSQKTSVTYSDAVDVALCYGWIDSLLQKYDDESYLQKFSPRRSKSVWSKLNVERIERLLAAGRMKQAGLDQVEQAKKDGRWIQAYDSPANTKVPEDFLTELAKYPKAKKFFETLNKANTYAIAWRLHTAKKPETREKRKQELIKMLKEGKKLH